jgi:hypothetical protein
MRYLFAICSLKRIVSPSHIPLCVHISSAALYWQGYRIALPVALNDDLILVAVYQIKVKDQVVPDHAMKACRGSRGIAPVILNLGIK